MWWLACCDLKLHFLLQVFYKGLHIFCILVCYEKAKFISNCFVPIEYLGLGGASFTILR